MQRACTILWLGLLSMGLCSTVSIRTTCAEVPEFLVRKNAQWKYFAQRAEPPEDWNQAAFDDAEWKSGVAGFGYGDGDDRTVLDKMRGRYTSVYIRTTFEIDKTVGMESLYLYLNFDDGFIAYLNGKQVAAAAVKPAADTLRVELHEAQGYEEFVIKDAARTLVPGKNVLAIEGHNAAVESSDFSLDPFLMKQRLESLDMLLGVEDYLADLDEFEVRLLDQSSYLTRRGFDVTTALGELRATLSPATRLTDFARDLHKLVMKIGDCHAGAYSNATWSLGGFLPLRPADTAEGIAALGTYRDEPLDPDCPYIESIDGLPLQKWMDAASHYVPRGSPQLIRRRSLERLGSVSLLRDELGLPSGETVMLGLRSADGKKQVEKKLRLARNGYGVAEVRLQPTRKLDGNIGYIRLPAMYNRLVEPTAGHIKKFRDTDGLIIDVRNNGGGTYAILRGIYGFFIPDDAKPYITNIAAYRLSPRFAMDHIAYRPTYRADWPEWSDEERDAIRQAAAAFQPEWQPPDGKFSEWHYMVLSRQRSGRGGGFFQRLLGGITSDYFFYNKPVVVLCNAGSFSATDGFLSAFADLRPVTIVGEPSGGGSGATRRFQLPNTQVVVALSSMASFRANGKLFDGNGIEVDVAVKPTVEDFTTHRDSVLQRGIAVIKEKSK